MNELFAGVDKVGLLLSHGIQRVNRESTPKISINHFAKTRLSILSVVNVRLGAVCALDVSLHAIEKLRTQPLRQAGNGFQHDNTDAVGNIGGGPGS